jgi:D-glycero-D-manno-heptose 1,7-bisphosphate phosphatase
MKKALILDRDGTLIKEKNYLNDWRKIEFIKGNFEGLKLFQSKGFLIFIVSNQSGVARNLIRLDELKKIDKKIINKLKKKGIKISKIYNCIHHPKDKCKCRKPEIYFGKQIKKKYNISKNNSLMIGNNLCDKKFAKNFEIKYFNIGKKAKDFKSILQIGNGFFK